MNWKTSALLAAAFVLAGSNVLAIAGDDKDDKKALQGTWTVTKGTDKVKLTFDGIPERLVIPFASIKVFIDPSVRFGLQFEENAGDKETPAGRRDTMTMDAVYDQVGEGQADGPRATLSKKPRSPRKVKADKEQAEGTVVASEAKTSVPTPQTPAAVPAPASPSDAEGDKAAGETSGAQILSLDQFRKK